MRQGTRRTGEGEVSSREKKGATGHFLEECFPQRGAHEGASHGNRLRQPCRVAMRKGGVDLHDVQGDELASFVERFTNVMTLAELGVTCERVNARFFLVPHAGI